MSEASGVLYSEEVGIGVCWLCSPQSPPIVSLCLRSERATETCPLLALSAGSPFFLAPCRQQQQHLGQVLQHHHHHQHQYRHEQAPGAQDACTWKRAALACSTRMHRVGTGCRMTDAGERQGRHSEAWNDCSHG